MEQREPFRSHPMIEEREGENEKRRMHLEEALRLAQVRGVPGRIEVQDSPAVREEASEHGLGGEEVEKRRVQAERF